MKILLIHNYYQFHGGEDTYVNNLTKLLRDRRHKVVLYTKNSKPIKSIKSKVQTANGMFTNENENYNKFLELNKSPRVYEIETIYSFKNKHGYENEARQVVVDYVGKFDFIDIRYAFSEEEIEILLSLCDEVKTECPIISMN